MSKNHFFGMGPLLVGSVVPISPLHVSSVLGATITLTAVVLSGILLSTCYLLSRREPLDLCNFVIGQSIDVVKATDDVLETQLSYPDVEIAAISPHSVWAKTDPLFETVLGTLVENIVEENDVSRVSIGIRIDRSNDSWVVVRITDHSSSLSEDRIDVLFGGQETLARHSNRLGLRLGRRIGDVYDTSGLWLVKWFVDHYKGEIQIKTNDPQGSVVIMRLPAANAGSDSRTSKESSFSRRVQRETPTFEQGIS